MREKRVPDSVYDVLEYLDTSFSSLILSLSSAHKARDNNKGILKKSWEYFQLVSSAYNLAPAVNVREVLVQSEILSLRMSLELLSIEALQP